MSDGDWIPGEEISLRRLEKVLERAGVPTWRHSGDELLVESGDVTFTLLVEESEPRFIAYMLVFGFEREVSGPTMLGLANRLNNEMPMARFTVGYDEQRKRRTMTADYFIPCTCGISVPFLLESLEAFARAAVQAVLNCDHDELLVVL